MDNVSDLIKVLNTVFPNLLSCHSFGLKAVCRLWAQLLTTVQNSLGGVSLLPCDVLVLCRSCVFCKLQLSFLYFPQCLFNSDAFLTLLSSCLCCGLKSLQATRAVTWETLLSSCLSRLILFVSGGLTFAKTVLHVFC